MYCYRDMTFCTEEKCKKFETCYRALTEQVKEKAGKSGSLICVFCETPDCFEEKE